MPTSPMPWSVVSAPVSSALPKVYVKVYARLADGTVKFHKDGYTDHRGRFDYATVSTPRSRASCDLPCWL